MLYIRAAAIIRNDGVIVEDRCHSRCINKSPLGTCNTGIKQGFVTSDGAFVDRRDAGLIAWNAGQLLRDPRGGPIFSEQIWEQDSSLNFGGTGVWYWDETKMSYIKKE